MENLSDANIEQLSNVDAEMSLLGAMLIDNHVIPNVAQKLQEDDFYRPAHRVIFGAMRDLYEQGKGVDLIVLTEHLKGEGQLDAIGGVPVLYQINNITPTAAYASSYAQIVKGYGDRRRMLELAQKLAGAAFDLSQSPKHLMKEHLNQIADILPSSESVAEKAEAATVSSAAAMADPADETIPKENEAPYRELLQKLQAAKATQNQQFALPYLKEVLAIMKDSLLTDTLAEQHRTMCKIVGTWSELIDKTIQEFQLPDGPNKELEAIQKETKLVQRKAKAAFEDWDKIFDAIDKLDTFSKQLVAAVNEQITKSPLLKNPSVYTASDFEAEWKNKKHTPKTLYFSALRKAALEEHVPGIYEGDQAVQKILSGQGMSVSQQAGILAFSPRYASLKPSQRAKEASLWVSQEKAVQTEKTSAK